MKNIYLVEVIQSQVIIVSVNAENSEQAIDKVNQQDGEVTERYAPEIITNKTKIIREC